MSGTELNEAETELSEKIQRAFLDGTGLSLSADDVRILEERGILDRLYRAILIEEEKSAEQSGGRLMN
jgi:hypothetical protein